MDKSEITYEWVQIVEPRTKEFMYANLITGECLWEPPSSPYKHSDETEWWELYDNKTNRFYYYNAKLQETVWHRPHGKDIIPLAKLQAIKRSMGGILNDQDYPKNNNYESTSFQNTTEDTELWRLRDSCKHIPDMTDYQPMQDLNYSKIQRTTNYSNVPPPPPPPHMSNDLKRLKKPSLWHQPKSVNNGRIETEFTSQDITALSDDLIYGQSSNLVGTLRGAKIDMTNDQTYYKKNDEYQLGTGLPIRHSYISDTSFTSCMNTSRPRAFPRTNPTFSSTYRRSKPQSASVIEKLSPFSENIYQNETPTLSQKCGYANSDEVIAMRNMYQYDDDIQVPIMAPKRNDKFLEPSFKNNISRLKQGRNSSTGLIRRVSEPEYVNVLKDAMLQQQKIIREHNGLNGRSDHLDYSPTALKSSLFEELDESTFSITKDLYDINFDDSLDQSNSCQSTPSPHNRYFQTLMPPTRSYSSSSASSAYHHPSLRRKKWSSSISKQQHDNFKGWLAGTADMGSVIRPISMYSGVEKPTQPTLPNNSIVNKVAGTILQQMHIEQFVVEILNEHRKGLLGKALSVGHMLSWTKDPIQKPMLRSNNKQVKKEAPEIFKSIQSYMGDRKSKELQSKLALDIAIKGWSTPELRDEIYIQLCRQTSKNPRDESVVLGWELLGIILAFFPPSLKFYSYLDGHISKNIDAYSHTDKSLILLYMTSCQRRLELIIHTGAKRGIKKPSIDDVDAARKSLVEQSMFGSTLAEIMTMQRERFPDYKLPWIQTMLSQEIIFMNGLHTEGIFRVPGDIDEVNTLKNRCENWLPPSSSVYPISSDHDPHVPASLLKLWYRELHEPLIPYAFYSRCIEGYADVDVVLGIVDSLPEINKLVLMYLVHFLQEFARPENVLLTKMDVSNLAMVMAPNCLRCLSNDPHIIFENTRREMSFIRTLILHLDTSSIEGVI